MAVPIIILWGCAGAFALFGVLFLARPEAMAKTVELQAPTPTAHTEIRAMYGGLELGIAAFLGYCALDPSRVALGLLASALLLGGIGTGRLIGVALARSASSLTRVLVVAEISGAALAAWSYTTL